MSSIAPVMALQPLDLALRQIDQRNIARLRPPAPGCAACRTSAVSARNQVAARSRTAASSSSAAAQVQCAVKRRAVRPIQRQRVDLDHMRQRHRRIAAAQLRRHRHPPPRLIQAGRRPVRAVAAGRKPPQIVEAELRRRQPRQAAAAVAPLR